MLHFVQLQAANWARGYIYSQSSSMFTLGLGKSYYQPVVLFSTLLLRFYLFLRFIFLCCSDICPHIWHTKGTSTSLLHPSSLSSLSKPFVSNILFNCVPWNGVIRFCEGKNGTGMIVRVERWVKENLREFETDSQVADRVMRVKRSVVIWSRWKSVMLEKKALAEPVQPVSLLSCSSQRLHKH